MAIALGIILSVNIDYNYHCQYIGQNLHKNEINSNDCFKREKYGWKNRLLIKIYIIVRKVPQMSLNSERNRELSIQKSRVSSSNSSNSQGYELFMPREQPYMPTTRDITSPRASFPFKKVQGGIETSNASKNNSDSRNTYKGPTKQEEQYRLNNQRSNDSKESIQNSRDQLQASNIRNNYQEYEKNIRELRVKIEQLQRIIEQQRNEYDLQRKANQIYTQGFSKIRNILILKSAKLEGESIQQLVEKLAELLQHKQYGNFNEVIDEQDKKIRSLRQQLLKSTQNNINAIFNTEITEAYCLQHQIQKLNTQINTLKQNLSKATYDNQENLTRLLQNKNSTQIQKIIKIYQNKLQSESEGEDSIRQANQRKRKRSKNNMKDSRDSSSSQRSHRKSRLKSTQLKIGEMIDGYKQIREKYDKIFQFLNSIVSSQTNSKQLFENLKKDILISIHSQIKEVKQTIKRPSSSHEQLKIAKQMQSKLNDLINTISAPQKATLQRSLSVQQSQNWKSVQTIRKLNELQAKTMKLQRENRALSEQKAHLQDKIMNISKLYMSKNRENHQTNELFIESIEDKPRKGFRRGYEGQQILMTPRSDLIQQHINEQFLSVGETNGHIIHTASFNKLHSSQSYHQSNSKNTQIQSLHARIQRYQQILEQKELRITELENTILDHIESKTFQQPANQSERQMREKYEIYMSNLKMLLNESRRQYEILKKELIKTNQMSLSRANDQDRNSITLSDRTTKNCIAQTRLIQRRAPKTNSFQSIKVKIQIEQALEKLFVNLLEFGEKLLLYEQSAKATVVQMITNCLRQLIIEARQRNCRLIEDISSNEQLRKRLFVFGIVQR